MPPEEVAALVSLNWIHKTATVIFFDGHNAAQRAYDARTAARQDKPTRTYLVECNDAAQEIYIAAHAYERTL